MPANIMTQPRSKWGFANPSKGLVQHEVKEGHKQQLLQEASSLLPDYTKLSDELLKNDLHYVDSARVKNQLDIYTSAYMDKYNQNPFFSFSREGRNLAKAMQQVVKDPVINALGQQYKKDVARYEQADHEGVTPQYDVNEQGIRVQDQNGRVTRKFKIEKGDIPLTIDDSYQYVYNVVGGAGGGFNYEMSSDKDLGSNITRAFTNIGDEKVARDILDTGQRIVQSGNNREVNSRIEWLKGQGLSQADLNRIYAEYTKKTGRFDMNEARKYVVHYVNDYAKGVRDSGSDISYIDDVRKAHAGVGGGSEKTYEFPTTYTSAMMGSEGKRTITLQSPSGATTVGEGNILTNDVFKQSKKAYTEDGIEYQSHKITDLDVFRKAIANGAYIPVAVSNKDIGIKAGELSSAPKSIFNNMVISEKEPPSVQIMVKDNKGNPAGPDELYKLSNAIGVPIEKLFAQNIEPSIHKSLPQDLRKFFSIGNKGIPELNRGYFLHGQGLVPRKRSGTFGNTSNEDKDASDYISSLGHNSIDDDLTRQEYNQYSGKKDMISAPTIGFNDQVYKVDVFIPVTNTEIFMGDKIRGAGAGITLGPTSRMENLNVPFDKGYLGIEPFNKISNPGKFNYYPNP